MLSTVNPSSSPPTDQTPQLSAMLWLLLLLFGIAAYRAFIVQSSGMNLYLDEAYYLDWSRHLAFGYYSKPPFVAWSIAAFTGVCGEGELCVKLSAFLWYAVAALFVALLAVRQFGREHGTLSGVALYTLPAVGFLSMTVSTDAPLLAFWAMGLWLFVAALDEQPGAWFGLGIAMGLGMLSKYTMVLFPISMFLYLLLSEHRGWLRMRGPWLALVVMLLVLAPNLWWNLQHGFPSITHTAEMTEWTGDRDRIGDLLEFLGGQLGIFGPLTFLVLLVMCFSPSVWRDSRQRMLLLFTLPLLMMYLGQAWLGGANVNWALAAYVSATPLLVVFLRERGRVGTSLLIAALVLNGLLNLVPYHFRALAPLVGIELTRKVDPWSRVLGWREMGQQVQALRGDYPEAALLGDDRLVLSEMTYYGRTPQTEWSGVAAWNPDGGVANQFELMNDLAASEAASFLYVGRTPLEALAPAFEVAEPIGTARHQVVVDRTLEVFVYHLEGFRGYEAVAHLPPSDAMPGRTGAEAPRP